MSRLTCRHCGKDLIDSVLNLGHQPPSNAYLTKEALSQPETTFPLELYVCTDCWLVQLPSHTSAQKLFTDNYAYFSSTSTAWCKHAQRYVNTAIERLSLDANSAVIEIACNDGYLLQYFAEKGIPCIGIEPTKSTAEVAKAKGLTVVEDFFGSELAEKMEDKADLVVANNVLAHVPDINDFMVGIGKTLKPTGVASIEFPHLLKLIQGNQFDTIYHEHYSYLSLGSVERIAKSAGLQVFDVEELETHGGSLRLWIKHYEDEMVHMSVDMLRRKERSSGLETLRVYEGFQKRAEATKDGLLEYLLRSKHMSKHVLGYGAAAKGNTLLNYAGIRADMLPGVIDKAASKQGKFLPGSHIPILSIEALDMEKIDELLVLPWNLIDEIQQQIPHVGMVTAVPFVKTWIPRDRDGGR